MRFVIVTGMSGAGKSTTLKMLEDMGYFCVDNLPLSLIKKFSELAFSSNHGFGKVALGIDIRSGQAFEEITKLLEELSLEGFPHEVLFLDASDEVLVKRYKETRRSHPLAKGGRIEQGIQKEREMLELLKSHGDYILDTSQLLTRELRVELEKIFVQGKEFKNLVISIESFGFKYGIPVDCDLVFDVRFLPNPYYVEDLRPMTGNDKAVQDYVLASPLSTEFLDRLEDFLSFLIPNYIGEGKNQLVIGIGCTGGKHRSVTLANQLYNRMNNRSEYGIRVEHRDIGKDRVV